MRYRKDSQFKWNRAHAITDLWSTINFDTVRDIFILQSKNFDEKLFRRGSYFVLSSFTMVLFCLLIVCSLFAFDVWNCVAETKSH